MPSALSHTIEIRVRFGETDPYGVAYFAAVLDYFKRGMDEFLRSRGLSPTSRTGTGSGTTGSPSWRPTAVTGPGPVRRPADAADPRRSGSKKGRHLRLPLFRTEAGKDILAAEGRVSCRSIDASWKPILPAGIKNALSPR